MTYKEKTRLFVNDLQIFSKLEQYVQMIEEKNKVINLTSFKEDLIWQEGIYESIVSLENAFDNFQNKKMLDIGAGVGFPSVPFKILHSKIKLFIYEPMQKRRNFLQEVSDKLNLNINIKRIRAENSGEHKKFAFITARAVTALKNLIEISFYLGKTKCHFVFIKGPNVIDEIKSSSKIIDELQLVINIKKINVENKEINLVKYTKTNITNLKYPRLWAKIIKEV